MKSKILKPIEAPSINSSKRKIVKSSHNSSISMNHQNLNSNLTNCRINGKAISRNNCCSGQIIRNLKSINNISIKCENSMKSQQYLTIKKTVNIDLPDLSENNYCCPQLSYPISAKSNISKNIEKPNLKVILISQQI